jgi:hypothetical protein
MSIRAPLFFALRSAMRTKSPSHSPRAILALGVASLLATYTTASAAIVFQNAVTVSGDTDVNTQGTLVQALDFSSTQTVNTVQFTTAGAGTNPAGSDVTYGKFRFQNATNTNATAFTSGSGAFSLLSSAYQNLQVGAIYNSGGGSTMTITLNNLNVGQDYLVQLWASDSRGATTTENVISGGINTFMDLDTDPGNAAGGLGQYVIGTFTASGISESFSVTGTTGSVSLINAMQLRMVPEPSTCGLVGIGVLAAGFVRRRRH